MKIKIWIFCSLFTLIATFSVCAEPISIPVNLPPTLTVADEIWQLGYSHEDNEIKTGEYTTNNENINDWARMVSVQKYKFIFPKEVAPLQFANNEIMQLKNKNYSVIYNVMESNFQEAIIEFRILSPKYAQQDELQRLIRTPDNEFVIFHYATKKNDMGEVERNKWINLLKSMNLSIFEAPYTSTQ